TGNGYLGGHRPRSRSGSRYPTRWSARVPVADCPQRSPRVGDWGGQDARPELPARPGLADAPGPAAWPTDAVLSDRPPAGRAGAPPTGRHVVSQVGWRRPAELGRCSGRSAVGAVRRPVAHARPADLAGEPPVAVVDRRPLPATELRPDARVARPYCPGGRQ